MKREDITGIFAEATKEQIDQLLNLNSADVTRALNRQKDDLTEAKQALSDAQATITELEKNKGDVTKLQEQIDAYREAEEQRRQQEAEAQAKAELEARFNAASGEKKYIHDMVRKGVMRDFGAALKDKANLGKGDKEIFEALTKDKGYFANQNPQIDPLRKPGDTEPIQVSDKAAFFKLSFADQMRYKQENEQQFKQLFGIQTPN